MPVSEDSVLFVTLDSCRFDTFAAADLPAIKRVSRLYAAQAPSHFTYGSHSAMFVGFTPGVPGLRQRFVNPKYARLFRLEAGGSRGHGKAGYVVAGRDIVHGFAKAGFRTLGTAAMEWFNRETPVARKLTGGFQDFAFMRHRGVAAQVEWIAPRIEAAGGKVFAFLNIGETHVPYHHAGAAWSRADNPCRPFQAEDRAAECRARQRACVEYVDRHLAPLLEAFAHATILLCADHGDCWGEDGLWEHGISHPMTLTVPLLIRYRGTPVEALDP